MKNKKIKNICIAVLAIVLFIYFVILINSFMNKNNTGFIGTKFYIMPVDSREVNIKQGDLVVAKSIKPEDLKENDSVIYIKNNEITVKKIKGVEKNNGKVNVFVDGDSLNVEGTQEDAQIVGKVTRTIKGIGAMALFIQSPLGTLSMLALLGCVFIIIIKVAKKDDNNTSNNEEEKEVTDEKKEN